MNRNSTQKKGKAQQQRRPRLRTDLFNLSLGLLLCLPGLCNAADIYMALDADGNARYASSKLDDSYTLLMRGEPENKAHTAPLPALPAQKKAVLARWMPHIRYLSQKHQVDLALVLAVIEAESRFNPQATSPKGAAGLMQLMPSLAARYGVLQRYDIQQNLEAGILYLKDLSTLHRGNIALVLASYNAGEGAVARHGQRIPPYKETMLYVPQVLLNVQKMQQHLQHSQHSQPQDDKKSAPQN